MRPEGLMMRLSYTYTGLQATGLQASYTDLKASYTGHKASYTGYEAGRPHT